MIDLPFGEQLKHAESRDLGNSSKCSKLVMEARCLWSPRRWVKAVSPIKALGASASLVTIRVWAESEYAQYAWNSAGSNRSVTPPEPQGWHPVGPPKMPVDTGRPAATDPYPEPPPSRVEN